MIDNAPVVTMLYAALCGVFLIALTLNVVRLRLGQRVPLGVGSEGSGLEQPVRVHGNFTEYAPTFLVLLLLAELGGAVFWFLHLMGVAFLVGRMLHAYGLSTVRARSFGRFYGSVFSWSAILVLCAYVLIRSFG